MTCVHTVRPAGTTFFPAWAKVVGLDVAGPPSGSGSHRYVGLLPHIWRHEMSLLPHACNRQLCAMCVAVESRGLDLTSAERRPNLVRGPAAPTGRVSSSNTRPTDAPTGRATIPAASPSPSSASSGHAGGGGVADATDPLVTGSAASIGGSGGMQDDGEEDQIVSL